MLSKFTTLFLLALFVQVPAAGAQNVLVVQSLQVKPYEEAVRGYREACKGRLEKLISSDLKETEVSRTVREAKPDLILAVGTDALAKVRKIRNVPIVYLMVLNPGVLAPSGGNITGVSMRVPVGKQLALLRQLLPHAKVVGVLYDSARNGEFIKDAQLAASVLGIQLLAREVSEPREAVAALHGMMDRISALWMVPDSRIMTQETVDALLLSATEHRLPVLTFSDKYLEKGALIALNIDPFDLGKQGGELACRILSGTDVRTVAPVDARNAVPTINLRHARKLGIPVNTEAFPKARFIR